MTVTDLQAERRARMLAQLHRVEALRRVWFSQSQTDDVLAVAAVLPAESVAAFLGRVAAWCSRYTDDGEPPDEVVAHAIDVAFHRLANGDAA